MCIVWSVGKFSVIGMGISYQMATSTPRYGVYAAVVIINEDASLDLTSALVLVQRMVESGIAGNVIKRSNDDSRADHSERMAVVRAIQAHCNDVSQDIQLIVECGAPSVQTTLVQIGEAKDSGADSALVLPPTAWTAAINVPPLQGLFCDV